MTKVGEVFEVKGEITIEWRLKKFSSFSQETNARYVSPKFYFSGVSWEIWLYPNGRTESKTGGCMNIGLMRNSSGSPATVEFSFSLKKSDGERDSCVTKTVVFDKKDSGWTVMEVISRSVLTERKSDLIPSDTLTIVCTLKNSELKDAAGSLFSRYQELSDNLNEMYAEEKRTDCLLKIDGNDIPAHRMILEARVPVFAAMFSHDTKENQTGEVSIVDIDKSTMEDILEYIYTGDIDNPTAENVLSLYAAAEKYDINYVKELCLEFIMRNLSEEWVCDVIKFAELYQDEKVGRCVREYFKENIRKIRKTEKWKMFVKENPELSIELLDSVVTAFVPE